MMTLRIIRLSLATVLATGIASFAFAQRGKAETPVSGSCFEEVCSLATNKNGVREITYEQFQKIRGSGEAYVLLDVLPSQSYEKGHIQGAESFPIDTIDLESAPKRLKPEDKIIVYCGSFQCTASTMAAQRLQALGYKNVLDYKGGLKEWQEKGNTLAK